MIFVGIDVAKEKHDCFMINSDGIILADVFTIPNNKQGFHAWLVVWYGKNICQNDTI